MGSVRAGGCVAGNGAAPCRGHARSWAWKLPEPRRGLPLDARGRLAPRGSEDGSDTFQPLAPAGRRLPPAPARRPGRGAPSAGGLPLQLLDEPREILERDARVTGSRKRKPPLGEIRVDDDLDRDTSGDRDGA